MSGRFASCASFMAARRRQSARGRRVTRLVLSLALAACALGLLAASAAAATRPPKIKHVWVIVLENEGYVSTFGEPAADPYLASTLPSQGALLENYYATAHVSDHNYIALISGQPPNAENQGDCQFFDDFKGAVMLSNGVVTGTGCVYPAEVQNIGTQLSAKK